jgi:hypothetical protein
MSYAYKEMSVAPSLSPTGKTAFEATDTLVAGGDGVSILIPAGISAISVQVTMSGGGTCNVQTTTDPVATVKSGSGITWVAWDKGTVSSTAQAVCAPVTALKLVQVHAGACALSVRAQ